MDKYPSEILSLTLNEATFHNETVPLAAVNFFFGNNGTGKTTLARSLKTGMGVAWNPERQPDDYTLHLYDRTFVEDNLRSSSQLAGVFTLDEQNIQVEDQIAQASKELDEQRTRRNKAKEQRDEKNQSLTTLTEKTAGTCWDKSTDIRTRFPATQEGKKKSKQRFFDEVLSQQTAKEHDLEDVGKLYSVAFDVEARTYPRLAALRDEIPDSDLLGKAITSSADTEYAQFVKTLGALGWIEQGHAAYATEARDTCPYCAQKLPENFEEQLAASIDDSYRADVTALKAFASDYQAVTSALLETPKSHQLADLKPGLDLAEYDTQLELLRVTVEANLKTLDAKIQQPATIVTLEPVQPVVEKINRLIGQANTQIDQHNTVVNNQRSQQQTCIQQVWEHLAFDLDETVTAYRRDKATLESEIAALDKEKAAADQRVHELELDIENLTKQTVNTAQTMITINKLLHDSGFEGFKLREKPSTPNVYEVIRANGEIADRLSEGERNFIAFLYFYFHLQGSLTNTGEIKDKIVIIDDPVSSMDTGALFIVAALIRELVNITLNNWGPPTGTSGRDHIKQIFVLTHNAYFFKEATYNRVSYYKHVSYYLVRKHNNVSSVLTCVRNRHDAPSLQENYSPVANAYATLWQEYKEVSSSTTLLNVMRRILEHYFLQLCGHDGANLRTHILEDHRDQFITVNDDGSQDLTDLRQAESILAYINHEMTGLGDDTFYIEHAADSETCRRVFHSIFNLMGQEQHYNMMMQQTTDFNAPSKPVGAQQTTIPSTQEEATQ
ncbi:AAA family ATPase [Scrofimicrobium canadense]|uniref:AAA family ATPase n=1 Tax=Scrofimicrobium canadense TaxID=2652290 RepID=UPI00197D8893|nr:AAA family ATPase [Scrofimicrobium canadense]